MVNKTLIGAAVPWTAALLLSGCGGGGGGAGGSMPVVSQPQGQLVDTQQVLGMARVPSDTGDPKVVGAQGLMVADADDETSAPLPVG
jgi:hypothetical protein